MNEISCRICGSKNLNTFLDLGIQPPSNSLLDSPDEEEKLYPLALRYCTDCNLVQLGYTVDPKELFSHYVWVTGTSKGAQEFARTFQKELEKRITKKGYVLELASNDGTFLKPFQEKGYEVLGIDPARNIADKANKEGIPTLPLFWGKETAKQVEKEHGKASVIFARNVLPHVVNTRDFVEGIAACLEEEGLAAIEVHYAKIILEGLHYDSIYHEHLCYFTLKTLEFLLNKLGLFVCDIMDSPISGGSIVVYVKKEKQEESEKVREYRREEEKSKVNEYETWLNFGAGARAHTQKLLEILKQEKEAGRKVVGWGASARSSTLLNCAGIGPSLIEAIGDLNPLKQGKWTAGTRIPIEHPEMALKRNPDSLIILAWNFKDEIKEQARQMGFGGEFIIPLPNDPKVEI